MTKGCFFPFILNENYSDFIETVNYTKLGVLFISSMTLLAGEKNKTPVNFSVIMYSRLVILIGVYIDTKLRFVQKIMQIMKLAGNHKSSERNFEPEIIFYFQIEACKNCNTHLLLKTSFSEKEGRKRRIYLGLNRIDL